MYRSRKMVFVALCAVGVLLWANGTELLAHPPGADNAIRLGPGSYTAEVVPPLGATSVHTIDIGEGPEVPPLIDGHPAGFTEPPPVYEDASGNLWYFFEDGTVWVFDTNNTWHTGTYQRVG